MKALSVVLLLVVSLVSHAAVTRSDKTGLRSAGKADGNFSVNRLEIDSVSKESEASRANCVWEAVYCDAYTDTNVSGYSLFRARDRKDLGNAVWTGDATECTQSARFTNAIRNGLFCARFYNNTSATTAYSVYRISDNQDLGKATIGDFETCKLAVRSLRNGIFCSTYVLNGQTMWSMYDVYTGNDMGTQAYATLDRCEENY